MLIIELCSGFGGLSHSFSNTDEIVSIDIDKKFKPTICADVRFLPLIENLHPDILLMSPPCERTSIGCSIFPKHGIGLALQVVGACLESVVYLKPKKWLMENPKGRLRWFIGKPSQTVNYFNYSSYPCKKPTDLWGNIYLPLVKGEGKQKGNFNEILKRSPKERARVSPGLSTAIKEGCTHETKGQKRIC